MSEEELALKLTELKFKNYTYKDYCNTNLSVLDFYGKALETIKEKRWLDDRRRK